MPRGYARPTTSSSGSITWWARPDLRYFIRCYNSLNLLRERGMGRNQVCDSVSGEKVAKTGIFLCQGLHLHGGEMASLVLRSRCSTHHNSAPSNKVCKFRYIAYGKVYERSQSKIYHTWNQNRELLPVQILALKFGFRSNCKFVMLIFLVAKNVNACPSIFSTTFMFRVCDLELWLRQQRQRDEGVKRVTCSQAPSKGRSPVNR